MGMVNAGQRKVTRGEGEKGGDKADGLKRKRKKRKARNNLVFHNGKFVSYFIFFCLHYLMLCLFIEEKSPFPSMFTYAVGGKENIMILFCVMLFDRKRE